MQLCSGSLWQLRISVLGGCMKLFNQIGSEQLLFLPWLVLTQGLSLIDCDASPLMDCEFVLVCIVEDPD